MNQDSENFDELRKLLALKKHEQPPPGYFNELPGKIWTRIEREEAKPSFWSGFMDRFILRPTVAYGFALVVCAGLIVGIGTSLNQNGSENSPKSLPIAHQQLPNGLKTGTAAVQPTNGVRTNPQPFHLQVQPAAFNQ